MLGVGLAAVILLSPKKWLVKGIEVFHTIEMQVF
jgi:hypothetical protein